MTTKKCSDKNKNYADEKTPAGEVFCGKSPDKTHCWHVTNPSTIYLPGGTNEVNEFCCWCGESRSYTVNVTACYSNIKKHGPHYKETYII